MSENSTNTTLLSKLFFPVFITVFGIIMIYFALDKEPIAGEKQTDWFLYGALTIFVIGVSSILYMLEIINKMLHTILMVALIGLSVTLTYLSIVSVRTTQSQLVEIELTKKAVIQGLSDIRDIQIAYKKKTGKYTDSFDSLRTFLLEEKTYKTVRVFKNGLEAIPDRQPTPEECAILGYDLIKDEAKIKDGIDESEALKLDFLEIDTTWYPIMEKLFTGKDAAKKERPFVFNVNTFEYVPMSPSKAKFVMEVAIIDSVTNYFRAYDPAPITPYGYKPGQPHNKGLYVGSLTENSTTGSWGN